MPVARWKGHGGETNFDGASLETLVWAAGLLAATKHITVFATVHVPLVHPLFAAKQIVTADHVGDGRAGINIVAGDVLLRQCVTLERSAADVAATHAAARALGRDVAVFYARDHNAEERFQARRRRAVGHGGYPLVGDPDRVAAGFAELSAAGFAGIGINFVNSVDGDAVLLRRSFVALGETRVAFAGVGIVAEGTMGARPSTSRFALRSG